MKRKTIIQTLGLAGILLTAASTYMISQRKETRVKQPYFQETPSPLETKVTSKEQFFSLDTHNLLTRILLLEDDTFATTKDVAKVVFQRAYEKNETLPHSVLQGAYSGVNKRHNRLPTRAIESRYTLEQLEKAHDIIKEILLQNPPYQKNGADHFMHKTFPLSYPTSHIKQQVNTSEAFRKRYGIPEYAKGAVVEVIPHSSNVKRSTYMLLLNVYK